MGRAIEHEKDIDKLKADVAQLKTSYDNIKQPIHSKL